MLVKMIDLYTENYRAYREDKPLAGDDRSNTTANPTEMEIIVVAGADGRYELYEDDGSSMEYLDGRFATTCLEVQSSGDDL